MSIKYNLKGSLYRPFSPIHHVYSATHIHMPQLEVYWNNWVWTASSQWHIQHHTEPLGEAMKTEPWIKDLLCLDCNNRWHSIHYIRDPRAFTHHRYYNQSNCCRHAVCLWAAINRILRCWFVRLLSMTNTFTESPDRWKSHYKFDDRELLTPAGRGPLQPLHWAETCPNSRVCSSPYGEYQLGLTNRHTNG